MIMESEIMSLFNKQHKEFSTGTLRSYHNFMQFLHKKEQFHGEGAHPMVKGKHSQVEGKHPRVEGVNLHVTGKRPENTGMELDYIIMTPVNLLLKPFHRSQK